MPDYECPVYSFAIYFRARIGPVALTSTGTFEHYHNGVDGLLILFKGDFTGCNSVRESRGSHQRIKDAKSLFLLYLILGRYLEPVNYGEKDIWDSQQKGVDLVPRSMAEDLRTDLKSVSIHMYSRTTSLVRHEN